MSVIVAHWRDRRRAATRQLRCSVNRGATRPIIRRIGIEQRGVSCQRTFTALAIAFRETNMRIAMRVVTDAYEALARGDACPLVALIPAGIEWRIVGPASRPHGIVCRTPVDVQKYFGDLFSSERITSFEPDDFIDMGEQIVVIGFVASATKSTGEFFKSQWVHIFDVQDGLRTRWSDFLDSSVPIALDVLPLASSASSLRTRGT